MDAPSTIDHLPQTLRASSPLSNGASPRRAWQPEQRSSQQGVKRPHPIELDAEEGGPKKGRRKDTRTADERRLFGHYDNPSDAVPIRPPGARSGPPATDPSAEIPAPGMSKKVGNKGKGFFKPQNNLNSEPHAAKRQAPRSTVAEKPQRRNTLETHPVRGGNVRPTAAGRGDGFAEAASVKRQKLSDGSGQGLRTTSPVVVVNSAADMDLAGDANDEGLLGGKLVTRNDRKPSSSSQSSVQVLPSSKYSKKLNPFDRDSIRTNDELLNGPRRRGQVRSQQQSQQAISRSRNGNAKDSVGTHNEPVEILEDDPATSRHAGSQIRMGDSDLPPQQQLNRDAEGRRRHGMDDESEVAQARQRHDGNAAQGRPSTTKQDMTSLYFQPKQRARDKMQKNSKTSVPESLGSADELSGQTTVGHDAHRELYAFPEPQNQRVLSEADIKTAKFTASGKQIKGSPARPPPVAPPSHDNHQNYSRPIAIRAFYASSCLADDGDLRLVFDESDNQILLYQDDKPVKPLGKQSMVHIGPTDARHLCYNTESFRVVLKGAMTGVSSGCMCIALHDREGVNWLMDHVQETTKGFTRVESISAERLDKMFQLQTEGLVSRYKKALTQASNDEDPELAMMQRRQQSRITGRASSEERIRYEYSEDDRDGDQPRPQDVRSSIERQQRLAHRPVQKAPAFSRLVDQGHDLGQRRSARAAPTQTQTRTRSPTPQEPYRWTVANKPQRWPHPVVYPTEGPRRTTIDFGDLTRLDEGEFLNDNLISFALRRTEENLSAEQRGRIHFFNTFFYSSLSINNGKREFNYDAVKRWTKGKDLMKTPYVVVPINHDLHWFVAIICNLDKVAAEDDNPDGNDDAQTIKKTANGESIKAENLDVEMKDLEISGMSRKDNDIDTERATEGVEFEEKDVADSRPNTATGRKSKKKAAPPLPKYDLSQPAVITLDSFGSAHSIEAKMLKRYVVAEAADKRDMTVDIQQIRGLTAKGLPEQNNFCDCGVFLIGYMEHFAKDPDGFVRAILQRELHENEEFANFDPSKKRDELRESLLDLQGQQEAERREKKVAKSNVKPRTAMPSLATAPQPSSPNKLPGPAAANIQMPRLPARPKEMAKESSSPSRQPLARDSAATSPLEAQVQGELVTAVPSPLLQLDANQPGDTVPNSLDQDYSDRGESTDGSQGKEDDGDEMLDKSGYAADGKNAQGKHTFFLSSPTKRSAAETLLQEDRPGLPAYGSGLTAIVQDSQE